MHKNGFSLVELSIVLVILGLLVGGVLSGQSLIRAAQLRSIMTEVGKYSTAAHSFQDKYFALPGDMTNATSFWGSLGGTGSDSTCQTIASNGTPATCNGNGDGLIDTSMITNDEQSRVWQHLVNASLIEGNYAGKYNPTGTGPITGTSMPASKFNSSVGWNLYSVGGTSSYYAGTSSYYFPGNYGNALVLVNVIGVGGHPVYTPSLTPAEEWNIDTKMDDGRPATGAVLGDKGTTANACTTLGGQAVDAQQDSDAQYNLSATSQTCSFFFFLNVI